MTTLDLTEAFARAELNAPKGTVDTKFTLQVGTPTEMTAEDLGVEGYTLRDAFGVDSVTASFVVTDANLTRAIYRPRTLGGHNLVVQIGLKGRWTNYDTTNPNLVVALKMGGLVYSMDAERQNANPRAAQAIAAAVDRRGWAPNLARLAMPEGSFDLIPGYETPDRAMQLKRRFDDSGVSLSEIVLAESNFTGNGVINPLRERLRSFVGKLVAEATDLQLAAQIREILSSDEMSEAFEGSRNTALEPAVREVHRRNLAMMAMDSDAPAVIDLFEKYLSNDAVLRAHIIHRSSLSGHVMLPTGNPIPDTFGFEHVKTTKGEQLNGYVRGEAMSRISPSEPAVVAVAAAAPLPGPDVVATGSSEDPF